MSDNSGITYKFKYTTQAISFEAEGSRDFVEGLIAKYAPEQASYASLVRQTSAHAAEPAPQAKPTKQQSPSEYVRQKGPKTGTEKLVILPLKSLDAIPAA